MDVLQFIRQMQEIYGDELIKPASELPRPQQALDREMFENAFRDKKADGGQLVKPNTDGSRPGYGGPQPGSVKNRFREWIKTADKDFLKTASIEDIIKKSKIKINDRNALNVFAEDEFKKFRPTRDFSEKAREDLKKLLKNKSGRMESVKYKGKEYFKAKDGRIREKINLKADRPEDYKEKVIKQQKKLDLIKNKDVFPSVGNDIKLMIWRDLYDSTRKRTYGQRAGGYEPPDPRLKVLNKGKINLTTDFVKNKLVLLDTKTGKKITFKNLKKYINNLPGTSYKDMELPYKYKTWLSDQTINYKGRTNVSLRTILRENLLTENELENFRFSPYEVHHPFGKNENPFKVALAMRKANGVEGNIRLETLKELDKAGITEKDVDRILNNFKKKINKLGGIQSGVRDVLVGEELSPENFFKKLTSTAKIGREVRPLQKNLQVFLADLGCPNSLQKASGGRVKYSSGSSCSIKGRKILEQGLRDGFEKGAQGDLARKILQAGKGLKDFASLRGLLGPAALSFLALEEAGYVGYDVLSKGKSFKEAIGDSTFNYLLGDRTRVDAIEERNKRMKEEGMTEEQMGKIAAYESALKEQDRVMDIYDKIDQAEAGQSFQPTSDFSYLPDTTAKYKRQEDKARGDLREAFKTLPLIENVDYQGGAEALAEGLRRNELAQLRSVDNIFQSARGDAARDARKRELMLQNPDILNYMGPYPTTLGFARGGLSGGDTSGPPPEKGPMSQGLLSLYKNGRKL